MFKFNLLKKSLILSTDLSHHQLILQEFNQIRHLFEYKNETQRILVILSLLFFKS